jgi:hypothetical protein
MTHRPVQVDQRKRAAISRRRRCALLCSRLCVSVFEVTLASTDTTRSRDCLSLCPFFCGRRPRPFEFTRPLPRLGRGPRWVSSVGRPATSPRFQPRWSPVVLRRTPSCHLAAHRRTVGGVKRLGFSSIYGIMLCPSFNGKGAE